MTTLHTPRTHPVHLMRDTLHNIPKYPTHMHQCKHTHLIFASLVVVQFLVSIHPFPGLFWLILKGNQYFKVTITLQPMDMYMHNQHICHRCSWRSQNSINAKKKMFPGGREQGTTTAIGDCIFTRST